MFERPFRLTSVAPDSMSCSALGMFTQHFMQVAFFRAGSGKLSFLYMLEGLSTIHDCRQMPDRLDRLPVNWGR